MNPSSIASLNQRPESEKRAVYSRFIPPALLERFSITPELCDAQGRPLAEFHFAAGSTDVILALKHDPAAQDPILYAHLTDTMNGQLHVLLYILNDPDSPRFQVDRMPDGSPTGFGLQARNLEAERAALEAGLAPGQIRRGLGMLKESIAAFEAFVASLDHQVYFIEPLYYHNAVVFERAGFGYQQGQRRMQAYHLGFSLGGDLRALLDGSSPFRQPWMADSIRGRSWALHDRLAAAPYSEVTMYKRLSEHAGVDTFPGGSW